MDKFLEEASVKWIEPRTLCSLFMESPARDETNKDERISFDADPPLNLEVTLIDVVKQKNRMLCPEKGNKPIVFLQTFNA